MTEMSHMSQNSQISCASEGPETSKPYTIDHDSIREPFREDKNNDDIL